jgi:hypothetical protein
METRTVTCPVCNTTLTVADRDAKTVYVETVGKLPEPCCQRAASDGHKKVGMFVTVPATVGP